MSSHRTTFKEVQHLPKSIVYPVIAILILALVYLYVLVYHMYLNETSIMGWSSEFKMMLGVLVISTILILALIFIVWNYRLVTKVSVRSFYYKTPPIINSYKKIYTSRILNIKRTTLSELPRGTVKIKMSGNEGVLVELEDDKRAFIGSKHAESLEKAFNKLLNSK